MTELDDLSIRAELQARIDEVWRGESDTCPTCNKRIARLFQQGRNVFALPCKHRLGQGEIHPNWRVKAKRGAR